MTPAAFAAYLRREAARWRVLGLLATAAALDAAAARYGAMADAPLRPSGEALAIAEECLHAD